MASKALGTTKQADTIEVQVAHDPRDSYSRSVLPTATANVNRLGLWAGWKRYEPVVLMDEATELPDGRVVTTVRFTRTA